MWTEIESVGARALQSLKIRTALVGAIAMLLVRLFHIGNDQANSIANGVLQVTMVLVGAQGLADFGKAGITQAAAVTTQTAVAAAVGAAASQTVSQAPLSSPPSASAGI